MGTQFNDGTDTAYDADGVRAFQSPPIVTAVEGISTAVLARLKKAGGTMTGKITLDGDPSSALHAATKQYVDGVAAGGLSDWKEAVRVATTTSGTLASSFENGDTIDGVVLATNDRILIKNQNGTGTHADNGIFVVQASGAPSRATDANDVGEIQQGTAVLVTAGSTLQGTTWFCTTSGTITPGTTAIAWVQTTAAASLGDGTVTSAKIADGTIATADLADDAVTYAKLQNVSATDRLLGRDTASAGNVEELSVTNGLEFTGSTGLQTTIGVRARADRATVFQDSGTTYAYNGAGTVITSAATSGPNNVTVIQEAINAIDGTYNATGHAGGGVVRLSDQYYVTTNTIELKYGVGLEGWAGFDRYGTGPSAHSFFGTTIRPSSIASMDVDGGATTTTRRPALLLGRGVSGSGTQSTTNPHGTRVQGMNIDMRDVTNGQGIVVADTQFVFLSQIFVSGASSSGSGSPSTIGRGIEVYSTNQPDEGAHGTQIIDVTIASCYVGIYANGSGSTDSFVRDSRILQCTNKGIQLGATSGGGGWLISGNHMTTGTATSCDHIDVAPPTTITNNYLDTCGGYHIIADGGTIIYGNIFKGNAGNQDGNFGAINLGTGSGRASTVMGNVAQLKGTYVALCVIGSQTGDMYRPVIVGNQLMTGSAATPVGIACTGGGVAIAETNAAMTVSVTGTNPYIYGNRIVQNAGF